MHWPVNSNINATEKQKSVICWKEKFGVGAEGVGDATFVTALFIDGNISRTVAHKTDKGIVARGCISRVRNLVSTVV